MAEIKWIKITTDIFDDEKIQLIESMPNADVTIVIWFKLLALAGKTNNCGLLMLNDKIHYTDEMLATIFRRPLNDVRLALQTFEAFGMIEITDNVISIPNWEKHQNIDGMDKIREQTRKRVAEHRKKQKTLLLGSNENCNVTVTESNATDKEEDKDKDLDKDKEKEEEIETKKERKKNSYDDILAPIENTELKDLYYEYIKMRKLIKAPMTDRALTMLINKVNELEPLSIERQKQMLTNAITSNWKSVYPLKDEKPQANSNNNSGNVFLDLAKDEGIF